MPHTSTPGLPRHFYSLDILRGLAALTVVFNHWRFFFWRGTSEPLLSSFQRPAYRYFHLFYDEGWRAVDLFFCLSGFIFFWLYAERVGRREVSTREFVCLRFSRLYPLHFLTLILVALGQWVYFRRYGAFFVYQSNDVTQFFRHLTLTAYHARSFNGPAWSISVEILLYAVFFVACRLGWTRWWHLAGFVIVGFVWDSVERESDVARGIFSFFVGGLAYGVFRRIHRTDAAWWIVPVLVAASVLAWAVVPYLITGDTPREVGEAIFPGGGPKFLGKRPGELIARLVPYLAYNACLFPLTIVTLATLEAARGSLGRRLAFVGNLSYSSYVLHFPLQLGLVLIGSRLSPASPIYESSASLGLFFLVLVVLSLTSYYAFERPAQSFLRSRLLQTNNSLIR